MRNRFLFVLLMGLFSSIMYSQDSYLNINEGDVFIIGKVHNNNYKHINFPRANFIIKKGGIANFNDVIGKTVEVTSIKKKKNGSLMATIKLTSKKFFFNSHKYVTVDIVEAINQNELIRI